jgi:hypothetical protein
MVRADVALFTGLSHYWAGMARILRAELDDRESDGLTDAAGAINQALEQLRLVREHEERIFTVAEPIEYSAYFVRRHEVISQDTTAFVQGLEEMARDLSDGYYPAEACGTLNEVLSRMMEHFKQDARIEGILHRFETLGSESNEQPSG